MENPARMAKIRINLDWVENWPPQSLDLNPTENVWRILKQRVKRRKPTTKEELKRFLLEEWEHISYEEINELILGSKGMHARMQQCWERQGLTPSSDQSESSNYHVQ